MIRRSYPVLLRGSIGPPLQRGPSKLFLVITLIMGKVPHLNSSKQLGVVGYRSFSRAQRACVCLSLILTRMLPRYFLGRGLVLNPCSK